MFQFPEDFYWGAATSAHQVEGDNTNSDWWEWEKRAAKASSGAACRHYDLFRQDFDLARSLNHNCHRLSVEWSRVMPQEGRPSADQLRHYQEVISALRERGLEPVVTLHHFTNPLWFSRKGGWLNRDSEKHFLDFVENTVGALCDKVRFWVTINEPMVYVYHAYILGVWPPQEKSFLKARCATGNLASSHIKAYQLIHGIYKKKNLAPPAVSIAKNLQAFEACIPTLKNKFAVYLRERGFNSAFLERLVRHKAIDFIGVNYYTRSLVEAASWQSRSLLLDTCRKGHSRLPQNTLGWDIYPEGLYRVLLRLKRFQLPVFILENGICTGDDARRWDFIREHLLALGRAMQDGLQVRGYLYWSLLDNFEWDKGFDPRFGLIEVDYRTQERRVRESARRFAEVCKTGKLE